MKVLVIGSGPIVIGQAAEFDYAGTQACRSLREEGCEVVLINSNPATIMTDPEMADALYIEPLTPEFCERVIARERPDALLPTLGGQTGLNLATKIAELGILEKYDVKLLGTPLDAIRKAEDREEFRKLMREIREPVPESFIIESPEQLKAILDTKVPDESGRLIDFPYPRIVRPAYTLGGTGGGIAHNPEELWEIGRKGLALSMRSQVMIERSLLGWKEIEYEVMRDGAGNCITVCNMENFDPMGVHTGDSIVVAPSQTLSDLEYHMLRTASLKIIRALGIEGGCNVQLAVNPESFDYYVIEVNPRVSRSSALASKATGYPIARVAAKIAIGKTLDQIENQVTKTTKACFEPALDYCVVKIPRWPFDKFRTGDRTLFTQMKATGEVMAIDRSFEAALLKAIRGMEVRQKDLRHPRFSGSGMAVSPGCGMTVSVMRPLGVSPRDPDLPERKSDEAEIQKRHGSYLPHWTREGATYAVVFRLADSVPRSVMDEWKEIRATFDRLMRNQSLSVKEEMEWRASFSARIDDYLDGGKGQCILKEPKAAEIVANALAHFDGERYVLHAWCVMPNHVHAVVEPLGDHSLEKILHSWKSYTSHEINKKLGHKGEVWQDESYDHLVRGEGDLDRVIQYVLDNPSKAGLLGWRWVGGSPRVSERGRDGHATHDRDDHATSSSAGGSEEHDRDDHATSPSAGGSEEHDRDDHATSPSAGGSGEHDRDDHATSDEALREAIRTPTDERLWAVAEGLRRGWGVDEINRISRIDKWFLTKLQGLVGLEQQLVAAGLRRESKGREGIELSNLIFEAFDTGFSSPTILSLMAADGDEDDFARFVKNEVQRLKVMPVFKMVDTCSAEFESATPYYYGTFEQEDDGRLAVP